MRKKKIYHQVVKRIMRPELTHCLECQSKLQRCVTISDRMIITLKQVIRLVPCGYRCPHPECSGRKTLYSPVQRKSAMMPAGKSKSGKIKGSCTRLMEFRK